MIFGKIALKIRMLEHGQETVITHDDFCDSVIFYTKSTFRDVINKKAIAIIVNEINSDEFPSYTLIARCDRGDWVLSRAKQ